MLSQATDTIVTIILESYPNTQAIYLFGSYGTEYEWPDSDVDIAVLLPPIDAKRVGHLALSETRLALEQALNKDVDLVNLRQVSTVFQKEIVMADRRIYCADSRLADEFELLVIALYQKLNEERAEILAEGLRRKRFLDI
ncbi:MAG: nucleotidyltransferase domain-containing protein [Anaerolineae bacterium]